MSSVSSAPAVLYLRDTQYVGVLTLVDLKKKSAGAFQRTTADEQHKKTKFRLLTLSPLVRRGFSEEDILEALDHCEHNFEAAASWLLGDRGHGGMDDDGEGAGEVPLE